MDPLPLSLLNDYLFCQRRAALKGIEGWRAANYYTDRGDISHEHADLPGYEIVKGTTLLRALPVWSERLGLSGKCDIVERRADGSYFPVEYKVGPKRKFENDDVQLCAQALCLEEMLGLSIPGGAIFHADSKRRRDVPFTAELRALTEQTAAALHTLLTQNTAPPAEYIEGRCEKCSLFSLCLPQARAGAKNAHAALWTL
jgi:CRISPR-associated exonuclease Cas4